MKPHAAIYARYSSKGQSDGTSIEVQVDQCRASAGSDAVTYIDRAVSGTIMDRPALGRLIADAEAGRISTIYVYKYDRFGRSAYAHAVVADLERLGVKVASVTEGHDPLARGIQLVVAEDYSRKLSERTRLGRARRFDEGKHLGGVPAFGYRVVSGRLQIEPAEAEAVRQAYEWYAGGEYSYRDISRKLRHMGFKPRRVRYWSPGMMKAFFCLPLYRGIRRHNGREVYTPHLRIVSDQIFNVVQRRNVARREIRRSARDVCVFTSLMVCGCCGDRFIRRVDRANGKLYPAKWVCGRRSQDGVQECPDSGMVLENELLADIHGLLVRVLESASDLVELAVARTRELLGPMRQTTDRHRRKLATLDREIERLATTVARVADPDAADVLIKRLGELKRDRDRLRLEVAAADTTSTIHSDDAVRQAVLQEIQWTTNRLDAAESPASLNALLRDTLGVMQVNGDGSVCRSVITSAGARLTSIRVMGKG